MGELRQELGDAIVATSEGAAPGAANSASAAAGAANSEGAVSAGRHPSSLLTIEVRCAELGRVAGLLYGRFRFTFLADLCAADDPGLPQRFQVVYHLYSFRENRRLRLRVRAAQGEPVPSVRGVWRAADWPEREAHEMLGVTFGGHPDLAPLLLWEGFAGHPLRKDFPLAGLATGAAPALAPELPQPPADGGPA